MNTITSKGTIKIAPPPERSNGVAAESSLRPFFRVADPHRPHRLRRVAQLVFLGICLWVGWRFLQFYIACLAGNPAAVQRPPGVEAFLPISALMSLRFWVQSGVIHPVHPAGLLIFVAILAVSFLFKRAFCSWVCPFGLLSEKLADAGRKIIGRSFTLPRWLDWPLRSLKYLLLGFFAFIILIRMDTDSLQAFLGSPFNLMADVRLLQFFLRLSTTAAVVLAVLAGVSLVVRHFWCRYLCPYGALTALAGLAGPTRITRNLSSCIDCGKCARACPASLPVDKVAAVHSDECTLCLECVESCPVNDTLGATTVVKHWRVRPLLLAAAIGGIFIFTVVIGRVSGHWQSSVSSGQLTGLIHYFNRPHP
jgi:polyferredoxin